MNTPGITFSQPALPLQKAHSHSQAFTVADSASETKVSLRFSGTIHTDASAMGLDQVELLREIKAKVDNWHENDPITLLSHKDLDDSRVTTRFQSESGRVYSFSYRRDPNDGRPEYFGLSQEMSLKDTLKEMGENLLLSLQGKGQENRLREPFSLQWEETPRGSKGEAGTVVEARIVNGDPSDTKRPQHTISQLLQPGEPQEQLHPRLREIFDALTKLRTTVQEKLAAGSLPESKA